MSRTVLILGAGLTRSAASTGPPPPLDRNFFRIAERIDKSLTDRVAGCLRDLVGDYADTLLRSLEAATTYLYVKAYDAPRGSDYHVGFLELLQLLSECVATTTNRLKIGPRSLIYRFLLGELSRLSAADDLMIITFNYDLLLERALESIAGHGRRDVFYYPGCYRLDDPTVSGVSGRKSFEPIRRHHRGVAVLKLHGSLNWQSKHTSNQPPARTLFNPKRPVFVISAQDIVPSLTYRNKRTVYGKPVIVPPVSGKREMIHREIDGLWTKARTALEEADRVVIAGYSCPPLDLEARILISEALQCNDTKKVYVIDPQVDVATRFVELCGVDHTTVFTSVDAWVQYGSQMAPGQPGFWSSIRPEMAVDDRPFSR